MYDNLKFFCEELNASFRVTVLLPKDYGTKDKLYDSLFIVSPSNPFLNLEYDLENTILTKDMLGFAIYPNLDIAKNKLLFNSFDETYNYARLYEDFIMKKVFPLLLDKYHIKKEKSGRSLLGINDTSILGYNLAYHFDNSFNNIFLHNLQLKQYWKYFLVDLKSKFNPSIGFFYSSDESELSLLINETLTLFGHPNHKQYDLNIKELLKRL